ncbi:nucleic acid-binding protein [Xylona heveae TC161]|uniref:Single-stranded DNA-binding protein n=1 Tax=Xylona heveae (strain CBS 132557 / TC161) TaxID=1328760 RepID=A0A164ZIW8_XYLHT|nr:nucleic acid-binding protein [Xylona heveae TC161]KZF19153.1 nucleic acid-binding protein [Xylona heveae TC161]
MSPRLFTPHGLRLARAFSTTPRNQLAKMTLIGRLAADPELTATSSGQEMVRYAIGTSYGPKDNRQTSWFRIASFDDGPRRDYLLSLQKGTLLYLEGDATMRTYEDSEGKSRSSLNIVQRSIEVLKRPNSSDSSNNQ